MDSLTMASSAVPPHLACVSTADNQDNVNDDGLEASVGPICESVPVSLPTMDTGGPDEVVQTKPIKPFSPGIPRSSPSNLSNEISKQPGSVGITNNGIPTFGASPVADETQDKGESEPGTKPAAELSPQFDQNGGSHGACPTVTQSYSSSTVGSSLGLSSVNTSSIVVSPAPGNASAVAFTLPPSQTNKTQQQGLRPNLPQPPKKPLSPYMRFSKEIWQKVKADNPGMSVCEVGATIGRIWRELDEPRKQLFILEFNNDKARYDTELQGYLRTNGLQASDIIKPRAKKSPKDPTSAKRSKGQNQKNHDAQQHDLATGTNYHRPTATSQCSASDMQQMNYAGQEQRAQEMSVALPSFSQVWSNPDATTQRDLLAQVVYDSQLHDERDISEMDGGANQGISIFTNQGQLATTSLPSVVCKNEQKIQQLKVPAVSQVKTEAGNWWWSVENDRNLGRNAFQPQTGSATVQQPSGGGPSFAEVAVKTEECPPNKTSEAPKSDCGGWSEGNIKGTAVVGNSWMGQQPPSVAAQRVQGTTGDDKGSPAIDAEKLFLRGALVEKTQEVVQLMRELDQAYGLIHQLKTQNDFFHRWYQEQRNAPLE